MFPKNWTISIDNTTTKFITKPLIQYLMKEIKKECEYKEEIMNDYYENEQLIRDLEATDESLFIIDKMIILSDLHLYRLDYFRVLADMEWYIRDMLSQVKKQAQLKFSARKAEFIINYMSSFPMSCTI